MKRYARKLTKGLGMIGLLSTLFLFSCYQGDQMEQGIKTPDLSALEGGSSAASELDSMDLLKQVQVKVDAVDSGISQIPQGEDLKQALKALRSEAQSSITIQKIDEALKSLEVQLLNLQTQQNLAVALEQVLSEGKNLKIRSEALNVKAAEKESQVAQVIEKIKKLLEEISYLNERMGQVLSAAEKNAFFASQASELKELKETLEKWGIQLQDSLSQALEKSIEMKGKEALHQSIAIQFERLTGEIGRVMASTSGYEMEKVTLAKNLVSGLKGISDLSSLELVKKNLRDLEAYFIGVIENLLKNKAEIQALIAKMKNTASEARLSDYPKTSEIQSYLSSLEQVNLDRDIQGLQELLKSIQGSYITLADTEKNIRESQLKKELTVEFGVLKNQEKVLDQGITDLLGQAEKMIQDFAWIQTEMTENRFSDSLLEKLISLKSQLSKEDFQNWLIKLTELEQRALFLKQKNSGLLPEIDPFYQEISRLKIRLEETFSGVIGVSEMFEGTLASLTEGLKEVKADAYPVSEEEVYVQPGENTSFSEKLLLNLLRLGKAKKGEIVFYRMERFEEEKEIQIHKRIRKKDGSFETVSENKKIKVKKMQKIAYKKWKLEWDILEAEKNIRLEIFQSLPQGGTWSPYSLHAYFNLKGIWYDFFLKQGKKYFWKNPDKGTSKN